MNKNVIIIVAIVLVLFYGRSEPITPATPLGSFVAKCAQNIPEIDKADIAGHLRDVAKEISSLPDPLFQSDIHRPQDCVNKIKEEMSKGNSAWVDFGNQLQKYFDQQPESMTIFNVGGLFTEIADALDPQRMEGEEPSQETDDIEKAYMEGTINGLVQDPVLEKEDEALFNSVQQTNNFISFAGEGKGKRAVYFNYAFRMKSDAYRIKQITGNCVFASASTICTYLNGVNTYLMQKPNTFEAEGSTAWYAMRGHGGQGSSPSRAAWAYLKYGYPIMKDYGNGFDLTNSTTDQKVGINNWRNPESSLAGLIDITKKTPIGRIDKISSNITQEELCDMLYSGAAIHFGGTLIGKANGTPVCSLGSVGPHAMSILGMDDTQEFKDWYKQKTGKTLNEAVFIFDNTWGEGPTYITDDNWFPKWGKQTGGTYVLKWSDTKRMLGSAYVWYPDLVGITPHKLNWLLANARINE